MGGYREVRMIKTFRGLMAKDTMDEINLHTNDGKTGYRIVKFQIMPENPYAAADKELIFKIWSKVQDTSAIDGVINFSDQTLLAAATYADSDGSGAPVTQYSSAVIFDSEIFNQDIYITYTEKHGTQSGNYYIELEEIKLNPNEAAVATLQSIRSK